MTETVPHITTIKIPWPNLAHRIEELGGLWSACGSNKDRYIRWYQALTKSYNPTLKTITEVLNMTGMTFEEAFAS